MTVYYKITLTSIFCFLLFSCQSPDSRNNAFTQSDPEKPVIENTNSDTKTTKLDEQLLISSQGIGDAKLGMTYGELKNKLGDNFEWEVVSPFMVDIDAIAVSKSGEIQYYLLYLSADTFNDESVIDIVMTENPDYSTTEGIKVGTSIKEAEKTYGEANLSYHTSNESREYVQFAEQPSNLWFRPTAINGFAGIYDEPVQEYNQTNKYQDNALINQIQVINSQF